MFISLKQYESDRTNKSNVYNEYILIQKKWTICGAKAHSRRKTYQVRYAPQNVHMCTICAAKRPYAYVLRYGRFAVLQCYHFCIYHTCYHLAFRMTLRLLSLVALCVVTVYGQTKYCCHPVTWESVNFLHQGQVASGTKKAVFTEVCLYILFNTVK
jgi:hypothetical protein